MATNANPNKNLFFFFKKKNHLEIYFIPSNNRIHCIDSCLSSPVQSSQQNKWKKDEKKANNFYGETLKPVSSKDEIKCNVHGSCTKEFYLIAHTQQAPGNRQPTEEDCLIQLLSL